MGPACFARGGQRNARRMRRSATHPYYATQRSVMRKQHVYFLGGLSVLVAVLFISQLAPQVSQAGRGLSVKDVGADPAAYVGEITITGVMTAVSEEDATIFGIMDVTELNCEMENCDMVILPIQFAGQLPVMGDEVVVTGSFTQSNPGRVFAAQQIEVIRNHSLGG